MAAVAITRQTAFAQETCTMRSQTRFSHASTTLTLALLFLPASAARADLMHGIGAMGSSTTDEYQFATLPGLNTARNWVEILAETRGWNFGNFTTSSRGSPRNQGYEYNWALAGATTASLLAQGQHTGLAAQITQGDVTLAFTWIGRNDFRSVLTGSPPPNHLPPGVVPNAVANTITALDTVLGADPNVRLVVATLPDLRFEPGTRLAIANGQVTQALVDEVSAGVRQYNAQITAFAATDPRIAVADLYTLFEDIMAPDQFFVGGVPIDRMDASTQPDHLWINPTNSHPGTIAQALIANTFIDTIDDRFGAEVPRLSDAEILGVAGIAVPEPSSLVLLSLGALSLFGYRWRFRKRAR
jgi:hypothetical protein